MSLNNVPFTTSRATDYTTWAGLQAMSGYRPASWPDIVLKELADNALDAAEQPEITGRGKPARRSPSIRIEHRVLDDDMWFIRVVDDGPGMGPELIEAVLDFNTSTSARTARAGLSRGRMGNGLKVVVGIVALLGNTCGGGNYGLVVESRGWRHSLRLDVDPVLETPRPLHERAPAETGERSTMITAVAPLPPGVDPDELVERLDRMVRWLATVNPHASIINVNEDDAPLLEAGKASKWTTADRAPLSWYTPAGFRTLVLAHIGRERQQGGAKLTVSAFLTESLQGVTTAVAAEITAAVNAHRKALEAYVMPSDVPDEEAIEALREAIAVRVPPAPAARALGVIGVERLAALLPAAPGAVPKYSKRLVESETAPAVVEVVCVRTDGNVSLWDELYIAINFGSVVHEGRWQGIDYMLAPYRAEAHAPFVFAAHIATPGLAWSDKGKRTLNLPYEIEDAFQDAITEVLAPIEKYHRTAIRESTARAREQAAHERAGEAPARDLIWAVVEAAYAHASDGGKLPVTSRGLMYAVRPRAAALAGHDAAHKVASDKYTTDCINDFIAENPECTARWRIMYDARGSLTEPHTRRTAPLGTVGVAHYLSGAATSAGVLSADVKPPALAIDGAPTFGPRHRYGAALFIEKEALAAVIEASGITRRLDLCIIAGKGQSTIATRHLIDALDVELDCRVFSLSDCDGAGYWIADVLCSDRKRHQWRGEGARRIGLTLPQVRALRAAGETVLDEPSARKTPGIDSLIELGVAPDEARWLQQRRVELNALSSRALVDLIERELLAVGVCKVMPPDEILVAQYRALATRKHINAEVAKLVRGLPPLEVAVPDRLAECVAAMMRDEPELAWDEAARRVLDERGR